MSEPGGAIKGAGGSGFFVVSALTLSNCTPCGFCTAAVGGASRKLDTANRSRKPVKLAIESRDVDSRSVDSRDVDIWNKVFSREESVPDCGVAVTLVASYDRPSW